jgi:L-amino acid N-acyltransferase YncA
MTAIANATVRRAVTTDRVDMLTIYNASIQRREIARHASALTLDELSNDLKLDDDRYRAYVATIDGAVLGWAALRPWHFRAPYARTLELLVYVTPSHRRRGLGSALLRHTRDAAFGGAYHTLVVLCAAGDEGAARLLSGAGFARSGTLSAVFHGPTGACDVDMYQFLLNRDARP